MENLVECLESWAHTQPDKILYSFLDSRGQTREQYSYKQLHERSTGLAQPLAQATGLQAGDRVLLVYPPGLELMVAFFASLNLGVIPVPVCAPASKTAGPAFERIEHVARDCDARVALTTSGYLRGLSEPTAPQDGGAHVPRQVGSLRWVATDTITEQMEVPGRPKINPILFLQYTSGSTGNPKGVIVTHRNVIHNARVSVPHCPVGVSWLPQYHDMGLIGHHLFVAVLGGTNYGFSPFDFLKRPALWLQTISRVRGTMTAAPNFAYGYCLREDKFPDADLKDLDLSSMKLMLNGAEPVQPETYRRFYERFAPFGLPRESYEAAYGLAENTLVVSRWGRQTLTVQKQRLQRGHLCIHKTTARNNNQISLVSCGQPPASIDVRIVDPESHRAVGENAIGEIWVSGESKCAGYWQRPEQTQAVFHARIEGESDSSRDYLRTGDLGFLHEGDLFVCGRIKDMIIIHGTNYYPQDIEAIIEAEFPNITPGGPVQTAAFAVDHDGEERLVVAIEVSREQDLVDPATVASVIRSRYFIDPYQVILVPPRTISKTTSGKVARSKTRDRWLSGALHVMASYVHTESSPKDVTGLRDLVNRIQQLYRLNGDEEVTLTDIGLDSLTLVNLTLEIQRHFEHRGLAEMVSELDARFLQRLTVAELCHLLEVYDAGPDDVPAAELRTWLETRQKVDDANETRKMRADIEWHPATDRVDEARENPQSVFMTGASGFFGPFLLGSMLQRTTCSFEVLMRATDPDHGRRRLADALRRACVWSAEIEEQFHNRVRVTCGDLGLGQFGLSDNVWRRLSNEIDAVLHNGAQVNYVLSYDALRPHNVGGTRELLRLAASNRKKPFHFVSSTFIHGWSASPIASEQDHNDNMEDLDFGYAQSKCVAEHMVRAAERYGLPVRIYRPALISASSRGVGSRDDILVRLLAFMIKHGIGVEALNQTSFLPADLVSDHIARMFLLKDVTSSTLQITTSQYYNIMDVTRTIAEQFGYSFTYMSTARFIEEMNRLCTPDDLLYPLMVFFNRSYEKFKPMEHKRYDNRHYRAALKQAGPEILEPEPSDTVAYIVEHMQRNGLVPSLCLV